MWIFFIKYCDSVKSPPWTWSWIPGHDRPKVKTVSESTTAKCLAIDVSVTGSQRCVTVGVACKKIIIAQWPWMLSIGQNLKPISGKDDVSLWGKNSSVGWKTSKKQTLIYMILNEEKL